MGISAVIMAGGRGERFWPCSRDDRPKQFLTLYGEETLLQRTARRLEGLVSSDDMWVVTREDYADLVYDQLADMPRRQVLLEPQGRDTAPCIALSALYVAQKDPDAVMILLPADHLILQEEGFRGVMRSAVQLAQSSDSLVTIGIRPTRPETGYGYIRQGLPCAAVDFEAFQVSEFTEKPALEVALSYVMSGQFLWNSGIFVWKASTILAALHEFLPDLMSDLAHLVPAIGTDREDAELRRIYPTLRKISIDYGVMEKAKNVVVIPAEFGWDDLGTWAALERAIPATEDGNVVRGTALPVDTSGSVIQSEHGRLVVAFGVTDLVIVDTADVVLVAHKERSADLKTVIKRLEGQNLTQYLRSSRVLLPQASD